MKNLPANLVLTLALALCALCGFQWVREARLRVEIVSLQQTRQSQAQALANSEVLAKRYEAEVARLDARVKEWEHADQTNAAAIAALQTTLRKAEKEDESLRSEMTGYKEAVERQNDNVRKANEIINQQNASIKEQNESLKRLAAERNDIVEKLNGRTREFNDVVAKYNDLVKQVEQSQIKAANK